MYSIVGMYINQSREKKLTQRNGIYRKYVFIII